MDFKKEFEKHMSVRQCEKVTKEMLYDLFLEGVKYGLSEAKKLEPVAPTKKKKDVA